MLLAVMAVDECMRLCGYDAVITSGTEGKHKRNSKHYTGEALDFRSYMLPAQQVKEVVEMVSHKLGPDFDVVAEAYHIHVEWDPKEE